MTNVSRLRSLSHCLICVCESLSDRAHPKINNEIGIYQVQVQMRKRDKKEKYPDAQLYRIVDRRARSKTTCLSSLVIHALLADHSLSTPCFCVCNRPSIPPQILALRCVSLQLNTERNGFLSRPTNMKMRPNCSMSKSI